MPQVTVDQHYVPKSYLKLFADSKQQVQVFDVRARRIGKPRLYGAVCYEKFFYADQTGVHDEVSQVLEDFFNRIETKIADSLPTAIAHAQAGALDEADLDMLAYMMSLQWLRTDLFRTRMQQMQGEMYKKISQMRARFPGFIEDAQEIAKEHGKEITPEQAAQLRDDIVQGKFSVKMSNRGHLQFLTPDRVEGFHNLFYGKQWNVLTPGETYRFITSDNPVGEWIPNLGAYGAGFLQRKHYFALTPELLIESLPPNINAPIVSPVNTLRYETCADDDVMMYNMVVAQHGGKFAYARGRYEFMEIMRQLKTPGRALAKFYRQFVEPLKV